MTKIRICAVKWFYEDRWHTTFYRSEPEARAMMREDSGEEPVPVLDYVEVEPTVEGIVDILNRFVD